MKAFHFTLIALLLFLTYLMVGITLPYLSLETNIGFLRIKQWVIENDVWRTAFFAHVFSSSFLLLSGFTQFSGYVIRKKPKLHRLMGISYVSILLFISAPSGMVMAVFANGGAISQTAFCLLSALWIFTTIQAYRMILKKDYAAHARYMIRSYALTLSALTLRLWKPGIALTFELPPMDLYRLVAWLGWVPNLIVAEILIRRGVVARILQKKAAKSRL